MNIGDVWNGWTVDSFIGEGSFGKVYKLIREEFGYKYESALKVIRIPQSADEVKAVRDTGMDEASVTSYFKGMVTEIVSELAMMSRLKGYTNIVGYEDHAVVELEDDFGWEIYLRMELLTPFNTYAREHQLTEADAVRLGIDICRALEICHRSNIIHRDIKSDNIFVSAHGEYKLGDFGIARQMEKTSAEMSKKGTVSYMAPEVYKGQAYDASVDTYSLGIMLYRLLNHNRLPFLPRYPEKIQFQDTQAALNRRLSGEPMPQPDNASDALAQVVLKACAYDPADRYTSPTEMRQALDKTGDGSVSYPDNPADPAAEAAVTEAELGGVYAGPDPGWLEDDGTVGMFADSVKTGNAGTTAPTEADESELVPEETVDLEQNSDKTENRPLSSLSYPDSLADPDDETVSIETRMAPVYASPDPGGLFGGGGGGHKIPVKLIAILAAAVIVLIVALTQGGAAEITGYDIQYNGEKSAGIVINDDSPFTITAEYSDGKTEEVTDWQLLWEWTLVQGENTVYIKIGDKTNEYKIDVPVSSSSTSDSGSSDAGASDDENDPTSGVQPESGFDILFADGKFVADADTVMGTIAETLLGYPYDLELLEDSDGNSYFRISNDYDCNVTISLWFNSSAWHEVEGAPDSVTLCIENAKGADWPYDEIISWTRCIMWALDSGADIDWDEVGSELREDMEALRKSTEVEGHSVSNQMCKPGDSSVVIVLKEDVSPDDYNVMELHFE